MQIQIPHLIRIMIAHLNRASGQAVVELTKKNRLPHLINLLLGIGAVSLDRGNGSQQLDSTERIFGSAVVALVVGLSGVCSAVQFKVQLAIPRHELVALGFEVMEEVID